jgi:hypothetical protein
VSADSRETQTASRSLEASGVFAVSQFEVRRILFTRLSSPKTANHQDNVAARFESA